MTGRVPGRFTSRVVGVSHVDGYPENLGRVELAMRRPELYDEPPVELPAELVRDPGNEHDPNAVEVHVLGERVGYLAARTAATLAPLLDAGEPWAAAVAEVRVSQNNPGNPAITVVLQRLSPLVLQSVPSPRPGDPG